MTLLSGLTMGTVGGYCLPLGQCSYIPYFSALALIIFGGILGMIGCIISCIGLFPGVGGGGSYIMLI